MVPRLPAGLRLGATLWLHLGAATLSLCGAAPALAQDLSGQDEELAASYAPPSPAPTPTTPDPQAAGGLAKTTAGNQGLRRTRGEAGTEPIVKISSRVPNRVQNRIRSRIDRNYDPQANATSPFEVAEERARGVGRPRVR